MVQSYTSGAIIYIYHASTDKCLYNFVIWICNLPFSSVYVNVDTHTFVKSRSTSTTYLHLSSCAYLHLSSTKYLHLSSTTYLHLSSCCHHLQLPLRYTCIQTCICTHCHVYKHVLVHTPNPFSTGNMNVKTRTFSCFHHLLVRFASTFIDSFCVTLPKHSQQDI